MNLIETIPPDRLNDIIDIVSGIIGLTLTFASLHWLIKFLRNDGGQTAEEFIRASQLANKRSGNDPNAGTGIGAKYN